MITDFLKFAAMAPSTRNTRPWLLSFTENQIRIVPDFSRWLPIDDPDQKQLYISLGCVLENLCIAACSLQYKQRLEFCLEDAEPHILLHLTKNLDIEKSPLFDMLEKRRSYRGTFGKEPIPHSIQDSLQMAGGDHLLLFQDKQLSEAIEDLNIQSEIELYSDPAFCEEVHVHQSVITWHPSPLIWKLHLFSRLFLQQDISSSRNTAPLVGLFFIKEWKCINWVEVGALLERTFLTATAYGLKYRPISNCLRTKKGRSAVQALFPKQEGIPVIGFYCGL